MFYALVYGMLYYKGNKDGGTQTGQIQINTGTKMNLYTYIQRVSLRPGRD